MMVSENLSALPYDDRSPVANIVEKPVKKSVTVDRSMQYSIQSEKQLKRPSEAAKPLEESKQEPLVETSEEEDMSPTTYLKRRRKDWPLRATDHSPDRERKSGLVSASDNEKKREVSPFRSNQLAQELVQDYKGYRKITSD